MPEQEHEAWQDNDGQLAHGLAQSPRNLLVAPFAHQGRKRSPQDVGYGGLEYRIERNLERADGVDGVLHRSERGSDQHPVGHPHQQAQSDGQGDGNAVAQLLAGEWREGPAAAHQSRVPDQPGTAQDDAQQRIQYQRPHQSPKAKSEPQRQQHHRDAHDNFAGLEYHRQPVVVARNEKRQEMLAGNHEEHVCGRQRHQCLEPRVGEPYGERCRCGNQHGCGYRAGEQQHAAGLNDEGRSLLGRDVVIEVIDRGRQSEGHDRQCGRRDQLELLVRAVLLAVEQAHQHHGNEEADRILEEVCDDQQAGLVRQGFHGPASIPNTRSTRSHRKSESRRCRRASVCRRLM